MTRLLKAVGAFSLLSVLCSAAHATTIDIVVLDGPAEGFNDPTPVLPVTGNPGETLGEQRMNVFQAAADLWETKLESNVPILVGARFDPLFCGPTGAVLGSAGPQTVHANFPNAPFSDVVYVGPVANSLADTDLSPADSDIVATFNSNLDVGASSCLGGQGWDYRIGVATGSPLDLFSTILHELAHGLGFLSLVDVNTGAKLANFDDVFMLNLADKSTGKSWPDMSNSERLASQVNTGNLVWAGPQVLAEAGYLTSGLQPEGVQMYAPSPVQAGSSVSHWDVALNPDELMEPSATASNVDTLTVAAFYEMGWQPPPPPPQLNPQVEVDLVSTCLAGNGRIDINIVNTQTAISTYRVEVSGLTARESTVAFEDWARFRFTGRPVGPYTTVVKRDGVEVLSENYQIDCSAAVPPISTPEVTIVNACRSGRGQVFFQLANPTGSSRPYVIEFENVPNRSTTAAAFGQARRGTTGRPDGTYGYAVRTGSTVIESGNVTVDCN